MDTTTDNRWKRHERALDTLKKQLERPRTARQLAKILRCSKPTVYARIRALQARGVVVKTEEVRDSSRGPVSAQFSIERKLNS